MPLLSAFSIGKLCNSLYYVSEMRIARLFVHSLVDCFFTIHKHWPRAASSLSAG